MAVLSSTPGITAEVIVNAEPATEYDYHEEQVVAHEHNDMAKYLEDHTIKKYIQSEDDELFSIRLTVGPPYIRGTYMVDTRLTFDIYFDGTKVELSPSVRRTWFKNKDVNSVWNETVEGIISHENGVGKLKKFKFASLTTKPAELDHPNISLALAEELSKVGIIKIEVYGETGGKQQVHEKKVKNLKRPGGGQVPETAMKGESKSHSITFGEATITKKSAQHVIAKRTSEEFPLAVFQFVYRDNKTLRQLQVLPDASSPETPQVPARIEQTTVSPTDSKYTTAKAMIAPALPPGAAELFAMFQKFTESYTPAGAASTASALVQPDDTSEDKRILIKRERLEQEREEARAARRGRLANGDKEELVTIDLTGDD